MIYKSIFFISVFLTNNILINAKYSQPTVKVLPLHPKGLRISIPDEAGISLVAYHAKINEDFSGLEAGTIAVDIHRPRNGRWTYENRDIELKMGDIIHYWIHVIYNGLGYDFTDQQHRVSQFYNSDGSVVATQIEDDRTCDYTETKIYDSDGNSLSACAGKLIFQDDFEGPDFVNETRWTIVEEFSSAPDYEFVVYRNSPENIVLHNSRIKLKPVLLENTLGDQFLRRGSLTLDRCTGRVDTTECKREARGSNILPPISSGRINTEQSFAFTYGRIEIRAKLPSGDWIYPLITLEPQQRISDFERNIELSAEGPIQLRVVSSTGNKVLRTSEGRDISGHMIWGGAVIQNGLHQNGHAADTSIDSGKSSRFSTALWSADFHVYELEWKPRTLGVSVDGVQFDHKTIDLPLNRPYYINIGVAVGGHTEFPDTCTSSGYLKPWRNVGSKAMFDFYNASSLWKKTWFNDETPLEVDYIKVYAL